MLLGLDAFMPKRRYHLLGKILVTWNPKLFVVHLISKRQNFTSQMLLLKFIDERPQFKIFTLKNLTFGQNVIWENVIKQTDVLPTIPPII